MLNYLNIYYPPERHRRRGSEPYSQFFFPEEKRGLVCWDHIGFHATLKLILDSLEKTPLDAGYENSIIEESCTSSLLR